MKEHYYYFLIIFTLIAIIFLAIMSFTLMIGICFHWLIIILSIKWGLIDYLLWLFQGFWLNHWLLAILLRIIILINLIMLFIIETYFNWCILISNYSILIKILTYTKLLTYLMQIFLLLIMISIIPIFFILLLDKLFKFKENRL